MNLETTCFLKIPLSLLLMFSVQPIFAEQPVVGQIVMNGGAYGAGNTAIQKGSGVQEQAERSVETFNRIKIVGAMAVHYQRANKISVVVSGDQNLLPLITTAVKQGELTITATASYQPLMPLVVTVSSPQLNQLSQQGSGDVVLADLIENTLQIASNGSGNLQITGHATQFKVNLQGSGTINAQGLTTERADAWLLGSGGINLNVSQKLNASITGSGDINYLGRPTIQQHIIGSGKVQAGKAG